MIGKKISHYSILEKLGEGGMGEVYLAEDIRLHRKVALKFLPTHLTTDRDSRERFEREARAAAALNHPNIVTVYDIGEVDGQVFMAIELVEGETLAERIASSAETRMPIEEIRDITQQIAEGLGKAHGAGIVHRDIKPSNIMIDREGRVKILDFGLAKLKGTSSLTKEVSTLGTVHYMSPEQARGEEVDGRSDIWSLGSVVYEMLTGTRPFTGEYDQHVIYSILNEDFKEPASVRGDVPPDLGKIVRKALRKDREERYRDAGEMVGDLEDRDREMPASGIPARRGLLKWILPALAVIVLAAVLIKLMPGDGKRYRHDPVFRQVTFSGRATDPEISPDGSSFAYMSGYTAEGGGIYFKDIESGSKVKIHSVPMGFNIQWAPDGSKILFNGFGSEKDSGVYLMPRLGGTPRKVLSTPWYFTSWAPDGNRFAFARAGTDDLFIMDILSGDTTAVNLEREVGEIDGIDWSPLGDDLLIHGNDGYRVRIWVVRTDGTRQKELLGVEKSEGPFISAPRWACDGKAIYYLNTSLRGRFVSDLMKVRFDAGSRKLDGAPYVVLNDLNLVEDAGIDKSYSMSSDCRDLIFMQRSSRADLWMMRAEGEGDEMQWNTRRLTNTTMLKSRPSISPDGEKIVFGMGNERSFDIYTLELPSATDDPLKDPVRLTYLESDSDLPVYSPDGREIAFYSMQGDVMKLWHVDAEGGTPKPYTSSQGSVVDPEIAWAPGDRIIYRSKISTNLTVLDPATGDESDLIEAGSETFSFCPQWSHSGDRVALFINRLDGESQDMMLVVVSVPDGSLISQVDEVLWPIGWSGDDRWLFAARPMGEESVHPDHLPIFRIDTRDGRLERYAVIPFPFEEVSDLRISPDGETIVYVLSETTSDIWLVEDFDPEFE